MVSVALDINGATSSLISSSAFEQILADVLGIAQSLVTVKSVEDINVRRRLSVLSSSERTGMRGFCEVVVANGNDDSALTALADEVIAEVSSGALTQAFRARGHASERPDTQELAKLLCEHIQLGEPRQTSSHALAVRPAICI